PDPAKERRWLVATALAAGIGVAGHAAAFANPAAATFAFASVAPDLSRLLAGVGVGLAATVPLALALLWLTRTRQPNVAAFREAQLNFFESTGFAFSWPLIVAIALTAGVWEEWIFRGVLQGALDRYAPLWLAVLAANVLFGLLHWQSAGYAVIAGLVGVYLSAVYLATGDLTAAIVTHAAYDVVTLVQIRRALAARRASSPVARG
ncbi:MAG: CPBP family intramembrane glutamic endopeptidase, partial [Pseudomonadota bacterium]